MGLIAVAVPKRHTPKRHLRHAPLAVAAAVVLAGAAWTVQNQSAPPAQGPDAPPQAVEQVTVHGAGIGGDEDPTAERGAMGSGSSESLMTYNVSDAREVAGAADDVFHGTVLRATGHRIIQDIDSALYEVRVGEVFKGKLSGTVTVTHDRANQPLKPGTSYVFATNAWGEEDGAHEDDEGGLHAVLPETRPGPTPSLDDPASTPDGSGRTGDGRTVQQYWRWAVENQVST